MSPPSNEQIDNIMNKIIEQEQMVIDDESKEYLLMITNGCIRNVINYLEKMHILGEPISIDLCKKICSNISFQEFEKYILLLKNKKITEAIQCLYYIYDYGYSVIDILD
jgi:DNA polymerase III gamma/tau subunit